MISTTIPIQGTFDIALGRRTLRSKIAAQRWNPTFNARASAALTALGELILLGGTERVVPVRLIIIKGQQNEGVKLACTVSNIESGSERLYKVLDQLERAADNMEIEELSNGMQVALHVWLV